MTSPEVTISALDSFAQSVEQARGMAGAQQLVMFGVAWAALSQAVDYPLTAAFVGHEASLVGHELEVPVCDWVTTIAA